MESSFRKATALLDLMTTSRRPGWGLRILSVRTTNGAPEALILPADHEAPFWTDLCQIAQHQARTIYEPIK